MTFSLGLGSGGGGNYIRFSPSINAWTVGGEEITLKKVLFDFDSLRTGWCFLEAGSPPQWVWDDAVGRRGPRPAEDYKRGFSIKLWLGPDRGWAEWSSNGTGPGLGMEALAAVVMPQKSENEGKVAVCQYTGSRAEKIGKGSTRVPAFDLIGWTDRPADDTEAEDEAPASKKAAPPATGSKAVPPPARKAAANLDTMDFG